MVATPPSPAPSSSSIPGPTAARRGYLRVALLGDSTTVGVGDPVVGGWRGWGRLLLAGLEAHAEVSACHAAVCGATTADVVTRQLPAALAHRPDLATLVVGMNDLLRSSWDDAAVAAAVRHAGVALHEVGATVLTVRFHDHAALLGLPGPARRPLARRIGVLNEAYDALHEQVGGVQVDLALRPEVTVRSSWSVDRFHPSERGHRALARAAANALAEHGVEVTPPSAEPGGGLPASRVRDAAWLVREVPPWAFRRARDLGPWAVRSAVRRDARTDLRGGAERDARRDVEATPVGS